MSESVDFENNNSKNLLVVFGGIKMGVGIPQFEFKRSLKEVDADKLFIRDKDQLWYQKGIEGHGSLAELKNYLGNFIKEGNYDHVCFLGNSMGGFISLLLGAKLQVDRILAFSPQTYMNLKNKLAYRDFRWMKHTLKMMFLKSTELDLSTFFKSWAYQNQADIYYGENHTRDVAHVERLKGIKGIHLHPINNKGHNVVRALRDNGKLFQIITDSLKS